MPKCPPGGDGIAGESPPGEVLGRSWGSLGALLGSTCGLGSFLHPLRPFLGSFLAFCGAIDGLLGANFRFLDAVLVSFSSFWGRCSFAAGFFSNCGSFAFAFRFVHGALGARAGYDGLGVVFVQFLVLFRVSIRRCFFLIVSFQRCSPSRPRMRTVSHEHGREDLLFIDVRLWLFDLRIIHFPFSTCRCSLEIRPCGLRAARLNKKQ